MAGRHFPGKGDLLSRTRGFVHILIGLLSNMSSQHVKKASPFCVVVHQYLPEQNQESWEKLIFRSIINIDFSVAITSLSGTIR